LTHADKIVTNFSLAFRKVERKHISAADSKIKVFVIPANEEAVIANDTYELTK
jgi:acetate kinase